MPGVGYADRVVDGLRARGLKVTQQRIEIIRCLAGNKKHPSAEQIHRDVSRVFPTISLATVYNTLETLLELGEIQMVAIDPRCKHYDPDTSHHHHALCTTCNTIRDVFADYSSVIQLPEEVRGRFLMDTAAVHFHGRCHTCSPYVI